MKAELEARLRREMEVPRGRWRAPSTLLRTAPPLPAWWLQGPRPLLRTPQSAEPWLLGGVWWPQELAAACSPKKRASPLSRGRLSPLPGQAPMKPGGALAPKSPA